MAGDNPRTVLKVSTSEPTGPGRDPAAQVEQVSYDILIGKALYASISRELNTICAFYVQPHFG